MRHGSPVSHVSATLPAGVTAGLRPPPAPTRRRERHTRAHTGTRRAAPFGLRAPASGASLAYFALVAAATVAFFALPGESMAAGWVFVGAKAAMLVALVAGILRYRPANAQGWWVLTAGHALNTAITVFWYPLSVSGAVVLGFPSFADAGYLTGYTLILIGVWLLLRARLPHDKADALDTAIVTVGLGVAIWALLMAPLVRDETVGGLAQVVALGYPAINVLTVAVVARIAFASTARLPGYGLLGVALLGQLGADIGFGATTLAGTFAYGHPLFAGWLLLYACAGAAVLHPGMARMTEPAAAAKPTLGSGRLLSLTGAALVPIVILLVQSQRGELQDVALIAMLTAVVFLLVIWRLYALAASVHEHERQQAKLKSQFTAAVSHELRTPLTAIHGALGLMAGGVAGELPGKACRLVDIARSNSGRLVRLINDILDLERFESGRAELRPTACPAAELAERAVEDLRPVADAAGVELRVRAEPAVVWADADRILQTLTNLLGNAIKFSDTGPAVEIRVASRDAQIRFEVRDEGRGIPPDKLETVFGRFEQVDASDMRAKGGTGLGLAICRTIVEQHGGRIWAESPPGGGSVFTFELPRLPASPPAATAGPVVVVCDDDASVLAVTGDLLTAHGYRVLPALSGNAALALIAEHAPEAVVLDLVMPGADGWEVAAQLRERPETAAIPIIILSVVTRGEEPEPAGGVCAWLDKPLDEDILLAALRRAVATQGRPPRLLLVEDDAGLAEILAGSFARHGLETIIAGTGAQALARAEQVPPDLIILDLALPEVDGYRVVEALQQRPWLRRAPLVVYSASDLDDQDRARLRLGETSFFTKGRVTPEAFERHVIGILERMIHQEGAR